MKTIYSIVYAVTIFLVCGTTASSQEITPNIAVMETAFSKRGDITSIKDAKAAGYHAIQMHSGMPEGFNKKPIDQSPGLEIGEDPSVLKSWKAASKEHGVEIMSLCAGSLNKCQIWDKDRDVAMRIATQTIDACNELDAHVMLFPFFEPSNFQTGDEALQGVATFIRELLPYARERDVIIGIEAPVTTVRVLELMEMLEFPDHLKIYYDTGNLFAKEDIYETIRKYGKQHFCEVHIKAVGHAVVGKGQIDLAKLAEALDAAKYDKWLVYEANRNGREPVANRQAIENLVSLRRKRGELKPWSGNPWYWSRGDTPVLLLGGSDDDNLFQWPQEKLIPQLDRIVAAGGNVVRNTMSDRQDAGFEVYPYLQLPNGKYDLNQWNPDYWQRFETFLAQTAKRSIVVQIEVWDRFDFTDLRAHDPHRWEKKHPYNPQNNVNYSFEKSGFAPRYPDHPGRNKQPFFFTTPKQRNNQVVLKYQERFVNKLLDHSLKCDHVLYCIDNETKAEPEWGEYWARFIKTRAAREKKTVMVTEMWDDWDLKAPRHRETFDHPKLYDFVDVSQNNQKGGQEHWDNFLYVRRYLSNQPRPMNTTKTYGADGNKFKHTDQDAIERFWRHLLAGAASIRFHRPNSGLGINDKAVACIEAARLLEKEMPLWELELANQQLGDRNPNEAFLAANVDQTRMALYFPSSKELAEVTLALPRKPSTYRLNWINIDRGKQIEYQIDSASLIKISPPSRENWVAAIVRADTNTLSLRTERLFAKDNLVAWCIVPFDAKQRGPAARAAMLRRLGLTRVAYDWRQKHVPTFEEEILQYRKHGLDLFAFWDWHESIGPLIKKHSVKPQIWKTAPSPKAESQSERIEAAAKALMPLVEQTRNLGLKLGLYNHGGWGGEPENLVSVCKHLWRAHDADHVGIVYNLHHAHHQMQNFADNLQLMRHYLLCLNLNGMVGQSELTANPNRKILPVGEGANDGQLIRVIVESGYDGPVGVLDHRKEIDAEESLRQNLDGLSGILRAIGSKLE